MSPTDKDPLGDIVTLAAFMKNTNGRVVLTGKNLACLRRVLRLHERLLGPQVCPCCRRLLSVPERPSICDECACGAHQESGCAHAGKVARECTDCGDDFWLAEAEAKDARTCGEKCRAKTKEAAGGDA